MGIPREILCEGDAKVLPGLDLGKLVSMNRIGASYQFPSIADSDDLTFYKIKGHLPVSFPGFET